jgi:hypothetical protein
VQAALALQPPLLVAHSLMSAVAAGHAGVRPCNKGMHVDRHLLLADIQCPYPALPAGSARGHHACRAAQEACHSHPRTCASEAIASEARLAGAGAACGGHIAGGVGAAASVVLRTHVDTCINVLKIIIIIKATWAARGQARVMAQGTAPPRPRRLLRPGQTHPA